MPVEVDAHKALGVLLIVKSQQPGCQDQGLGVNITSLKIPF